VLDDPRPLGRLISDANARTQVVTSLAGLSAATTVLIALLGVYSLITYGVSLRRRELAVRMALGADRRRVSWMVVRESAMAFVPGAAVGLVLAAAVSRMLESQLFGVRWYDPVTYGAVFVGLVVISALASWLPAFRASSTASLRSES
jgi:ABC-type antimicrobial peptide transport system permease subunit